MAETNIKWIKISTGIFDNRKIKQIEVMPEGDAILVIWLKLLVLAGEINDGGLVYFTREIPYTDALLANEFRKPINIIQLALHTFESFGMIEVIDDVIRVSNWERYQNVEGMDKIREQTRVRVQRFRAKQKAIEQDGNATETLHVTLPKREETPQNKNKNEKETIYISPSPEPATAAADEIETPPKQTKILSAKQERRFAAFWEHYPKKVGKQDAQRAWKRIDPDDELTDRILHAVEEAKQKDSRFREERYTPHPASWLNAGSWEDEFASNGYQRDPESSFDVDEFTAAAERNRLP